MSVKNTDDKAYSLSVDIHLMITMAGTIRTLSPEVRDLAEKRVVEICNHMGPAFGAQIDVDYQRGYPVTVNHEAQTAFAAEVAADVVGADRVDANVDVNSHSMTGGCCSIDGGAINRRCCAVALG